MSRLVILGLVLAVAPAPAFLDTLHASADQAQESIFSALFYGAGSASCPGRCGAVPLKARAEVARGCVAFARAFVASDAFKTRYASQWAAEEPTAPETPEAQLKRQADEQRQQELDQAKSMQEIKERIAAEQNPQMKKAFQDALTAALEMQKSMNDPKQKALMASLNAAAAEQVKVQYAEDKAKWDAAHAEWLAQKDPKVRLRKRLEAFIELASSVDFKAKTVTRDGRTSFVDPTFESKSNQWKQLYRLGPEGTEVLLVAAKKWKSEL